MPKKSKPTVTESDFLSTFWAKPLWAKKTAGAGGKGTRWILGFHPKTGIWGLPEMKEGYLAELPLTESTAPESAEQLTITLADDKGKGVIKIQWGTAVLTGSFGVG